MEVDNVEDMDAMHATIKEILLQHMPEPGHYPTAVPGFVLHRRDVPNHPENCFNRPILAVTIQGAKRTVVGNEEFRYGAGSCMVTGVDMPSMSYLTEASPEHPYLVVTIDLDSPLITELLVQASVQAPQALSSGSSTLSSPSASGPALCRGTAVIPTAPEVLQAILRLLDLLDKPDQVSVLAPLVMCEIHLRLLLGPAGDVLRTINTHGTQSNQVFRGINWLRDNFKEPLDVDELAKKTSMAPPTFRKHFKAVTSMSPTQYHKHLRLYEAQRLMLEDKVDATSAGYAVGYDSPAQFNREYKRLFGDPPLKNVRQLQ